MEINTFVSGRTNCFYPSFYVLAFAFCEEVRSTHIIWQRSGHLDSTHIDVDSCKLKAFLLFECTKWGCILTKHEFNWDVLYLVSAVHLF